MAHIDAGKTTTTERILYYTGRSHKMGEVHEGAATMDWMEQEQERGITITSAATTCRVERTTGSTSSTRPATSTSPSRSSARCACSTARSRCSTPSPASSRSPRPSGARPTSTSVPRIAYINKMDRIGADFEQGVQTMIDRLGAHPVPIQLPIGAEADFRGIIDLIDMKAIIYKDELGKDVRGRGDPGRPSSTRPPTAREHLLEEVSALRRRARRADPRGAGDPERAADRRDPQGDARRSRSRRSCAARPSRTRACSRCWTR